LAYLLGQGHDVALEDLDPIVPQPATRGMQYGRRQEAASGDVIYEAPYIEFEFSTLSVAAYQSLLTQFGLTAPATTADVSVYIQDEDYNWIIRNGVAVKPQISVDGQRDRYHLRNFTILVKNIRVQP
jgi:hypothetical protein